MVNEDGYMVGDVLHAAERHTWQTIKTANFILERVAQKKYLNEQTCMKGLQIICSKLVSQTKVICRFQMYLQEINLTFNFIFFPPTFGGVLWWC